eukprot:6478159-Amphidinium_carterae.1
MQSCTGHRVVEAVSDLGPQSLRRGSVGRHALVESDSAVEGSQERTGRGNQLAPGLRSLRRVLLEVKDELLLRDVSRSGYIAHTEETMAAATSLVPTQCASDEEGDGEQTGEPTVVEVNVDLSNCSSGLESASSDSDLDEGDVQVVTK